MYLHIAIHVIFCAHIDSYVFCTEQEDVALKEIFERRSVRDFLPQPVEAEKVDRLVRAACQAPSASNQQPWEFIVIRDAATIEALAEAAPYTQPARKAPLCIAVLMRTQGNAWPGDTPHQDVGAACENLLLEAVHLGLGAVWLGISMHAEGIRETREILGIPENILPVAVMAVGYPAGKGNYFEDRYDGARVFRERYGH